MFATEIGKLDYAQALALRQELDAHLEQLKEQAKNDLVKTATLMGIDLSDVAAGAKKGKHRGRGKARSDSPIETSAWIVGNGSTESE